MSDHSAEPDEKPLNPEQQKIVAKVRWLMLLSGLATMLGIAVVVGVIGYRMFRADAGSIVTDAAVTLPKGAKVHATAWYDNSAANKSNPDPKKDVTWGDQTWEEMMIGFFGTVVDAPAAATQQR